MEIKKGLQILFWIVFFFALVFFIAGVITVFVSRGAVLKYFGANAKKWAPYTVAPVLGTILPLFSSIHKRGARLEPALAQLLTGPSLSLPNLLVIRGVMGNQKNVGLPPACYYYGNHKRDDIWIYLTNIKQHD